MSGSLRKSGSLVMLIALFALPIACAFATCQGTAPIHDCCPKKASSIRCIYDELDSAKVVAKSFISLPMMASVIASPKPSPVALLHSETVLADDRDLHLVNRILRI
jgi:hypothetical protein